MRTPQISMKRVNVTAKEGDREFAYQTYRVTGTVNGRRVRQQFSSKGAAREAMTRLQVQALNSDSLHAVMTRLPDAKVIEAEAAFERLKDTGQVLGFAVDWFLTHYREPRPTLPVRAVKDLFLADRAARGLEAVTLRDYRQALTRFAAAMGAQPLAEITTDDILRYLGQTTASRPKSWNNDRADLNTFFVWCGKAPRRWIEQNPVAEVEKRKVSRPLPDRLSAEKVAEVMKYAETYEDGALAGFLALAFFSGIRPCARTGELFKLLTHPRAAEFINLRTGYIVLAPEVTKTNQQRQVKMEPNLTFCRPCRAVCDPLLKRGALVDRESQFLLVAEPGPHGGDLFLRELVGGRGHPFKCCLFGDGNASEHARELLGDGIKIEPECCSQRAAYVTQLERLRDSARRGL